MLAVDQAIISRRAVRRFLPTSVPKTIVTELLNLAARAPSGTNVQPWRMHVLAGAAKHALSDAILTQFDAGADLPKPEYRYAPDRYADPYLQRRRKIGYDLYHLLDIAKGDKAAMHRQHRRNYLFFDAPIGMICTVDRRLEQGSWLDCGMFLQTLAIAARGLGLDTCMQAAFLPFHATILSVLKLGPEELIVCGMALGYADPGAPENALKTDRIHVDEFATFQGFEAYADS